MSAMTTRSAWLARRSRSSGSVVAITAPPDTSASATMKASTASSDPGRRRDSERQRAKRIRPSSCPARTPSRPSTGRTSMRSLRRPAKIAASARRPRTTSARTAATIAIGKSLARISATSARTRSRRAAGRAPSPKEPRCRGRASARSPSTGSAGSVPRIDESSGPIERFALNRPVLTLELGEPSVPRVLRGVRADGKQKPRRSGAPGRRVRKPSSVSAAVTGVRRTIIHLGRVSPRASSDVPGSSGGPPSNASLFRLAPDGVCRATGVTAGPVSSYLTLSPLPRSRGGAVVYSLWHFPRGHPHQALPGILPCGARTFLPRRASRRTAGDRPDRSGDC